MWKRPLILLSLFFGLLIALSFAAFFSSMNWIERQRIADATPALQRLESLGAPIFSSPVAFHRYCLYVVEIRPKTKLSDENIEELLALNHLPTQNLLEVGVYTASITDESLPTLSKLTAVDTLDLSRSGITREGCAELQRKLPHCEIYAP